jgi:hypothetical protein
MSKLGFGQKALNWYTNYLTGRQQYTEVNGVLSSKLKITLGVPQGTVLGPLLYLIYTHDLPLATKLRSLLFADDTTLTDSQKTNELLHEKLQSELNILNQWFIDNKLTLNTKKSKVMCFHGSELGPLKINGEILEQVNQFKLVGITITSKLQWDVQATIVQNKISPVVYYLRKLTNKLNESNKILIYHALIGSHVNYGLPIWQGCSIKASNAIQVTHNKALRAVFKLNYNESTRKISAKKGIFSFDQTKCYSTLLLIKSTKITSTNSHLKTLFPDKIATSLRSGSRNLLIVPACRTANEQNQSLYIGPQLWNVHDEKTKLLNYNSFKENTKRLILTKN